MCKKNWIIIAILVLTVSLALVLGGCRKTAANDPTTEAVTTAPTTEATVPTEETEPTEEPDVISAGHMKLHPNGANGNSGIYFTMDPNDVPADKEWKTEFRPMSVSVIQLIRGGETYNVGNYMTGMMLKYSETEYYLKTEEWINRKNFPLQSGDILKVEGVFKNETLGIYFSIDTTYILFEEGLVFFSEEYPDESVGPKVVNVGPFQMHPKGYTSDGVFATADKNAVPVSEDWKQEYKPVTADAVKLIRGGKTYNIGNPAAGTLLKYSETDYYLKMEKWIIKDFYPLRDGDIILINGKFANSASGVVMRVRKTYIAVNQGMIAFSTEMPTELPKANIVEAGMMEKHPEKGWTSTSSEKPGNLYFSMAENDAPYATDGVRFVPAKNENVKLIRNGKTYTVGHTARETIVKISDTAYIFEFWTLAEHVPVQDGDILVVEGSFISSATRTILNISKTYIALNQGLAAYSAEMPTEMPTINVIDAGMMQKHPDKGWTSTSAEQPGNLYFSMAENDAPFSKDGVVFMPTAAENVKLIRDGQTYVVGHTARGTIVKTSETAYIFEFWTIADHKPIRDGDILVVEGQFIHAGSATILDISKTYIALNQGLAAYSAEMPTEMPKINVIDAGMMQKHPDKGWTSISADEPGVLYFSMAENDAPFSKDGVIFMPTAAENVKLIRDGQTYTVGHTARGCIVKASETSYLFEFWTLAEHKPVKDGDILIVEGQFINAASETILNISKTYVALNQGLAAYSAEMPTEMPTINVIDAGMMQKHPEKGWTSISADDPGHLYFSMAENDAPEGYYIPVAEENVKLIRDGQTYTVGHKARDTIVKTSTGYQFEFWTLADHKPVKDGDILIVEGQFLHAATGTILNISKTYVAMNQGLAAYSAEMPTEMPQSNVIEVGMMEKHPDKGWTSISAAEPGHLYFSMAENDAPEGLYIPIEEENVKLIRDGQTYVVGHKARETIVKASATGYLFEFWTLADHKPVKDGDILIVEGQFFNAASETIINITKTYVAMNQGLAAFSAEMPTEMPQSNVIQAGMMEKHPEKGWTSTSAEEPGRLYFSMAENAAPEGFYIPQDESNVKLIRGGQTYVVGHKARETIVKTSTGYQFEFWVLADHKPVQDGDILIVEGQFLHASTGTMINISRTYVAMNQGLAAFSAEMPTEMPGIKLIEAGLMQQYPEYGWVSESVENPGRMYFSLAENDAPNGQYYPLAEENVKFVRNGQTATVGHKERGTIVKAENTGYIFEFWVLADHKPVRSGDMLIVEGEFVHSDGTILNITKTYITMNADGTATFESEEDRQPDQPADEPGVIQAGLMNYHSSGLSSTYLFFTMAENDAPYHLTRAVYKPESASVIKLVRGGVTYDIGDPEADTVQKTTKSNYKLKLAALTDMLPLQDGDLLIIDGKFTGGNTNTGATATFRVQKTYILIVDGVPQFTGDDPTQ